GFVTFTDNGNGTGVFRFAPGPGDRGDYALTLHARDNGDGDGLGAAATADYTFIVTVAVANDPPAVAYVGPKVAVTGQPVVLPVFASDPEQETLTYTLAGLPTAPTLTAGAGYRAAPPHWLPAR